MFHATQTLRFSKCPAKTVLGLWLLFCGLPNAKTQPARTYIIQSEQSRMEVQVRKGGLFKFLGHDHLVAVRGITGHIDLAEKTITPAALHIKIAADSLLVIQEKNDKDRVKIQRDMREKVLETAQYPQIEFESTAVHIVTGPDSTLQYRLRIEGDLTLHGITRPIVIASSLTLLNGSVRAVGRFLLHQKEFGIKAASAAVGTVKVKDKLELSFDIVAQ